MEKDELDAGRGRVPPRRRSPPRSRGSGTRRPPCSRPRAARCTSARTRVRIVAGVWRAASASIVSRQAQKSPPALRPRSARWKRVRVGVDEAGQREERGHTGILPVSVPGDGRHYPWAMSARAVSAPLARLPNALTIARFALVPVFAVLLARGDDGHSWPAAIVFGIAAVTDQVDGWLARRLPRRVGVREVRRPARRPADDRRRRDHALRLRPAAVAGARPHRRPRPAARPRHAIRAAARLRVLRQLPREARDLDPLPLDRARDRDARRHRLAARAVLDRCRACRDRGACRTSSPRRKTIR